MESIQYNHSYPTQLLSSSFHSIPSSLKLVCRILAHTQVTISPVNNAAQSCSAAYVQLEPIASSPTLQPSASASGTVTITSGIRASRKDKHLLSTSWLFRIADLGRDLAGAIRMPSLPPFTMSRSANSIPATPRVISPSPTPTESRDTSQDGYFAPITRSARKKAAAAQAPITEEHEESDSSAELRRARSRSRSPISSRKITALTPGSTAPKSKPAPLASNGVNGNGNAHGNGKSSNGHLSPSSATTPGWSWRDISRSPSPLGLIPIHRHWRSFVHRHEVPRKILHVSIGFFTLWFYISGLQTSEITPWLMAGLLPIATTDYLRHVYPSINRIYVRFLGAFMRETEFAGWNGVIWYLLGAWIVLSFFPKDVAVMGVLLLSWCDTAASTFGRAYGRYTPRIRRGKSLAGSLAAFAVGVITAVAFWGYLAPRTGPFEGDVDWPFMFTGTLTLPDVIRKPIGLSVAQASISGGLALGVMSFWTGFVASASEVVDIFGWDDNLTIPVLSGVGMWAFLRIFG